MINIESFLAEEKPHSWGSEVERETRRRIMLSVAAYSYEIENDSIMSDSEFDEMAMQVNLKIKTGNKKMDKFFDENFYPDTGQWIHKHPEIRSIRKLYNDYYKGE